MTTEEVATAHATPDVEKSSHPQLGNVEVYRVLQSLDDDPVAWSRPRKFYTLGVTTFATFNGLFGSSLPAGDIDVLVSHFGVTGDVQRVLPVTIYQIGFVLGSLAFAPLSEYYGRRHVFLVTMAIYFVFSLASAWAPSWTVLNFFRWLCGVGASSTISVTGGLNADLYSKPLERGRANAIFLLVTTTGPLFGPIIASLVSHIGWQWSFWLASIGAGMSFILLCTIKETYRPVLLQRQAKKLRAEHPELSISAPRELERSSVKDFLVVYIARPLHMMATELMVTLTCLYLAYATGVYYLFFQAYPYIFGQLYQLNQRVVGLMYLPIVAGAVLGFVTFMIWDKILARARQSSSASWAHEEEYRRLPLACLGGFCCVLALFWLGWAASTSIHFTVPMLAGIPFGLGFFLMLMALNNYLADAYKTLSASAMAAVSCSRSLGAAFLPLAAGPMYQRLGIHWATSLLGFLSLAMVAVPFVFIKYGAPIRRGSKISRDLVDE